MPLSEDTQIQLDIIHDNRLVHNDPTLGATPAQVRAIVIALVGEVGEEFRIPVLRTLCGFSPKFVSTKQLTVRDANVIIDWLYGGQSPGVGVELTPEALETLHDLKACLGRGEDLDREEDYGSWDFEPQLEHA